MENPGLLHIGERILKHLHFKTQAKCRLVNRSWNHILENEASKTKTDLNNLLKSISEIRFRSNPKEVLEIAKKNLRLHSWIDFVKVMSSKMNNHVINILLKRHISHQLDIGFSSFPLEHFVLKKDREMVDLTLKHKKYDTAFSTYMNIAEFDFEKALKKAVENKYTDIVQCLKPYMTFNHLNKYIFKPTKDGDIDVLKIMYPNPKEALMDDLFGDNPIHIAASFGRTKIVKYFIENSEGLTAQNNSGHTPLYYAIIYNNSNILSLIIKTVSEDHILKPIMNGKNVIHIAAERGQLSFVYQLCKKVKNPLVADDKGNSPIHYAASKGHLQILQMLQKVLKSYWTDFTIPNRNGKTPLQLAKLNGHSKVVKYLSQF